MSDQARILNHLIEICAEARNFYEAAAEKTEDFYIKSVFHKIAFIRNNIMVDLTAFTKRTGNNLIQDNKPLKRRRPLYGGLMMDIGPDTDEKLVHCLEEAEDRTLEEFYRAMAKNLPFQTRSVISRQLETLRQTEDYLKALRDRISQHSGRRRASA